ncbi:GNAT family N-acetyltransferase [Paenibacillus sp. J5C_2022]|uniref:GNAT family N-acetyltransferase n=1 Tax=Paenibacillus sp. J5C2022 TaxID=2977129 RepID=UPI0021CF42E0|nr:GNAT family N-acetyltransferase [Paenibacillus sp. J5C2022]MCU6707378.1 GNAT family N-acetyltransferase [Paenibacillus sp. J5C2022]
MDTQANIWTGLKVRLRSVIPSDWKEFHENDQDSECARLCDAIYFPRSEDGTKDWAERTSTKAPEGDNVFLAIETHDGTLVGSITANSCDTRNGTFKYGVAIFRKHWRKGYASEAIRVLLRYYFEELRYCKVNAYVYAFNEGSRVLQEHLGFVQEGVLREMIFTKGKHYDEYVYGLTKDEFEQLNSVMN